MNRLGQRRYARLTTSQEQQTALNRLLRLTSRKSDKSPEAKQAEIIERLERDARAETTDRNKSLDL